MALSLLQVVAAMGVVGLGAMVQGAIGFGMAVVAAPVLYHIDPALVPGPLIFSGMAIGALGARRYASEIDVSILGYALLGRVPGSMIGVLILTLGGCPRIDCPAAVAINWSKNSCFFVK